MRQYRLGYLLLWIVITLSSTLSASYGSRYDTRECSCYSPNMSFVSNENRPIDPPIKGHRNLRAIYEYGFLKFQEGDYQTAMNTIQKLIAVSLQKNSQKYLNADTFVNLGIVCSLSLEYAQAVEALTEAIEKYSGGDNAYLERAISYFEQGDFELAIRDYLNSGQQDFLKLPKDPYKIAFGRGLLKGTGRGLYVAAQELPASLMYSVKGAGQLLWAGISDPLGVPERMIDATTQIIEYLRREDIVTIAEDMVPELRELLTEWDSLESPQRGEKTGFILGKYGINILSCYTGAKALQMFKELRQTNNLCNLEACTSAPHRKVELISTATQATATREQFFKTARIHPDKQGKHIVDHHNYKQLVKDNKNPSILKHKDPELLLREYAGSGTPLGELKHGAGYKEVVNFKEYIGDFYNESTKEFLPTTRGKIHYDKNGVAHIVPAPPLNSLTGLP